MGEATAARLVERLKSSRNADGGWGYATGRSSRLEPTCWALLALEAWSEADGRERAAMVDVLTRWPREGDWLRESASTPPNVAFAALALLTMQTVGISSPRVSATASVADSTTRTRRAIVTLEPLTTASSSVSRQNNRLRGWPWTAGEFSFAEPTAWCLLALKKSSRTPGSPDAATSARIAEAEQLLVDRVCAGGGWNHGNSNVFGTDLTAYVPTTALGLLALQDKRELSAVRDSLRYLRTNGQSEVSMLAVALAAICARVMGESTTELEHALDQLVDVESPGTTTVAWAAAACALAPEGARAFTV